MENHRPLSISEMEDKVAALEDLKRWANLEEKFWRQNPRNFSLRKWTKTQVSSIK